MFRWSARNGYDWQLIESDEGASDVVLGATLAYGMLDETVADYGTLQLLGGAIRAELGRPVELQAGGVSVPEAMVEIGQDTLTFGVRGGPEAAVSAWRRLAGYFLGTVLADPADPHSVDTWGWARDAASRCGMNGFVLSLLDLPQVEVAADKIDRLRRFLNPAEGNIRCVFFTTDESLVEVDAFPAPRIDPREHSAPAPGRARGAATPGSLGATLGPVQFSAVVPRTRTGLAVGLALRSHFAASLSSVGASGEDTGCVIHEFGADRWVTIACDSVPAPPHRDRAIARTLGTPMSDAMLGGVIAELRDLPDVRWARSRRVLGLPVDDEIPTVASVRSAIGAALNTVHVTALLGYSEQSLSVLPGYPELMPQLPHEGGQKFPAWFAAPAMFGGRGRSIAILGERTLTTELPPQSAGEPADRSTVDLDTAAVVIESGTHVAIFDTRARGVDLDTSLLRGGHKLREQLDHRLANVPRLKTVEQEEPTVVHGPARAARTRFVVGVVTVAIAVGAVITGLIVQNVTRAAPVTVRVDEGETATLAGGTTITVPSIEARADGRDLLVNTSVRICAGGDIKARDTDPALQRSVGPANFSLYTQDGMAGEQTDGGGPQLAAATIPEGECVEGDLSYRIRDTGSPLKLGYDNAFGDDIVWYDQA